MSGLEFTKKKFSKPKELDIESIFRSSFGIILPEEGQQVEEVELSFTPFQGKYIKSLPLHESQEIIHDNEQELRIKPHITHDFIIELLSYGKEVKVLHPPVLADSVKQHHHQAAAQY